MPPNCTEGSGNTVLSGSRHREGTHLLFHLESFGDAHHAGDRTCPLSRVLGPFKGQPAGRLAGMLSSRPGALALPAACPRQAGAVLQMDHKANHRLVPPKARCLPPGAAQAPR